MQTLATQFKNRTHEIFSHSSFSQLPNDQKELDRSRNAFREHCPVYGDIDALTGWPVDVAIDYYEGKATTSCFPAEPLHAAPGYPTAANAPGMAELVAAEQSVIDSDFYRENKGDANFLDHIARYGTRPERAEIEDTVINIASHPVTVRNWKNYGPDFIGPPDPRPRINIMRGKSPIANPFIIGKDGDRHTVIASYRSWLWEKAGNDNGPERAELERIYQLAQRQPVSLFCCCAPEPCHGNVIADLLGLMNEVRLRPNHKGQFGAIARPAGKRLHCYEAKAWQDAEPLGKDAALFAADWDEDGEAGTGMAIHMADLPGLSRLIVEDCDNRGNGVQRLDILKPHLPKRKDPEALRKTLSCTYTQAHRLIADWTIIDETGRLWPTFQKWAASRTIDQALEYFDGLACDLEAVTLNDEPIYLADLAPTEVDEEPENGVFFSDGEGCDFNPADLWTEEHRPETVNIDRLAEKSIRRRRTVNAYARGIAAVKADQSPDFIGPPSPPAEPVSISEALVYEVLGFIPPVDLPIPRNIDSVWQDNTGEYWIDSVDTTADQFRLVNINNDKGTPLTFDEYQTKLDAFWKAQPHPKRFAAICDKARTAKIAELSKIRKALKAPDKLTWLSQAQVTRLWAIVKGRRGDLEVIKGQWTRKLAASMSRVERQTFDRMLSAKSGKQCGFYWHQILSGEVSPEIRPAVLEHVIKPALARRQKRLAA